MTIVQEIERRDRARGARPCCFCRTPYDPGEYGSLTMCPACVAIVAAEEYRMHMREIGDILDGLTPEDRLKQFARFCWVCGRATWICGCKAGPQAAPTTAPPR